MALAAEPGEAGGDTAQVRVDELYMTCELLLCHPPGADEEDEVEDGEEGDGDGGHDGVALLADDDAEGIGVGGLAGGDEGDVFDCSQHRWFGPGLTNARIIFIFQKIENSLPILVLVLGVLPSPLEEQSEEMERLQVSWLSWVVKTAPQDEGPLQEEEEDDAAIEAGDAHGREPRGGRRRTWPTAQRRGGTGLLLERAGVGLPAVGPREVKEKL